MADEGVPSSTLATEGPGAYNGQAQVANASPTRRSPGNNHVKLPPFSTRQPTAWFQRAECNLRIAGITDEGQKADQIISSLPEEVFEKISSWMASIPRQIQFPELKKKLTDLYALSIPARAQRVMDLMHSPLGDSNVRESWDEIRGLMLTDEVDDHGQRKVLDLSREIFLRRLPKNVRAQLAGADALDMTDLVEKAYNLHEAAKASRFAATAAVNQVDVKDEEGEPGDGDEDDINAVHETPGRRPAFNSRFQSQQGPRPRSSTHNSWGRPPQPRPEWRQQPQQMPNHGPRLQKPVQQRFFSRQQPLPFDDDDDSRSSWCRFHRLHGANAVRCKRPCRFPRH